MWPFSKKPKIRQAVILGAGFGTRLRPLTERLPKVMVPLAGKPLLEHHITQLKRHGVREFFINVHYLPYMITHYFGDGKKWGVHIRYSVEEPEILGTAGGLKKFEPYLDDACFFVYGDMYSEADYSHMAENFFAKKDPAVMCIVGETNRPHECDLVEVDAEDRFLRLHQKPHTALPPKYESMLASYIIKKDVLAHIPAGEYHEFDHATLPNLIAAGKNVYAYRTDRYMEDVGNLERYARVNRYLSGEEA